MVLRILLKTWEKLLFFNLLEPFRLLRIERIIRVNPLRVNSFFIFAITKILIS